MRYLIDGYNLMYAGGLLGKRLGPDGFRKVRTRFLNDLADALGPLDAHQTTVVFDAVDRARRPRPRSRRTRGSRSSSPSTTRTPTSGSSELIAAHSAPEVADGRLVRPPDPPGRDPPQGPSR